MIQQELADISVETMTTKDLADATFQQDAQAESIRSELTGSLKQKKAHIAALRREYFTAVLAQNEAKLQDEARVSLRRLGALQHASGRRLDATDWWNISKGGAVPNHDDIACREMAIDFSKALD